METKSALVRSDSTVELYSVTLIYLNLSIVIYPRYTERNNTLWLSETLQYTSLAVLILVCINNQS